MSGQNDDLNMLRCIDLARRAEGRTAPNPMVGCVVVGPSGDVVGEGFHQRAGEPHAEVLALTAAGDRAVGGTLYVNLEPCCHWGRTPPCAGKVAESGVTRVVAGMIDPNSEVAGGGVRALREAGLEVVVGVKEAECRWLNRAFIKRQSRGLPWVVLKLASTLDGKIADRQGASRWITEPASRRRVHELRNAVDCVLVGVATAIQDDPELNVRDVEGGRHPKRAILDARLNLDPNSRLCRPDNGGRTTLFCLSEAAARRRSSYPEHVQVVAVEGAGSGQLSLAGVMRHLSEQDVLTVLCEGGGRLAGALLSEELVDEVFWFVSPKILGDASSIPAVNVGRHVSLAEAVRLTNVRYEPVGGDLLVHGVVEGRFPV